MLACALTVCSVCHWQVKFLQGTDGNVPWVWVMGEHKDDLSYEELVSSPICMSMSPGLMILLFYYILQVRRREEEEIERERQSELELRKEAEELAKNETRQMVSLTSE